MVSDFACKWRGGEADADVIFGVCLADKGVNFVPATEYEAWQSAFEGMRDSLITLTRR